MTRTGGLAGTPQYMSPEQARGESVDHRSDLFSLGSVLYTMCAGQTPFRADTPYGIMRRITDEEPTPLSEFNADIPTWLCTLIDRLMAKKKEDRFQSAREVHDLLERCLSHVQQPTREALPKELIRSRPTFSIPNFLEGWRSLTLLALALVALVSASIIYYIQTNHGIVKIEVNDPSLKVMIDEQTVTMKDGDDKLIKISVGEENLVIVDGDKNLPPGNSRFNEAKTTFDFASNLQMGTWLYLKMELTFNALKMPHLRMRKEMRRMNFFN